jgi:CMP-N-acetylneuraminic acid synthetase
MDAAVIAIIPARMGSQRVPRKNLRVVAGRNLIQHAINCAQGSGVFRQIVVTSDDDTVLHHVHGNTAFLRQPESLSTSTADISDVVKWALSKLPYDCTHVVTLQPAVMARSPRIIADLVNHVVDSGTRGGITMARSHPWVWNDDGEMVTCGWDRKKYPRSQNMPHVMCEINSVQVTRREDAINGSRWEPTLSILELPPWSQALDIDTEEDLAHAQALAPAMIPILGAWRGPIFTRHTP